MQALQQLLIIDALLSNWPMIQQLILKDSDPSVEKEISRVAARLSSGATSEVSIALDDLFDLTEDTAAGDYVDDLLRRYDLSDAIPELERSFQPGQVASSSTRQAHAASAMGAQDAKSLGAMMQAVPEFHRVPVFFATNRRQVGDNFGRLTSFSGEQGDDLSLGLAVVTIPLAAHRIGEIEQPNWWKLFQDGKDKESYMVIENLESLSKTNFSSQLDAAVGQETDGDLLVFMHGYNVKFDEAVMRSAQVAFDLKFNGAVVLFSWPSLGTVLGYSGDEARAAASGERLAELLMMLEGGPWRNVHLMAHSMGNRVLVSGLADNPRPDYALGQVVMVSADVNVDVFEAKHPKMADAGALLSSYVSTNDRALLLSSILHRGSRIGFPSKTPYVRPGMETIDATAVNTSFLSLGLGHSYFSDNRSMLTDLGYLLRQGLPADSRQSLRKSDDGTYWTFPK